MSIGDVPVSTGEAGPGLRVERCRPRKISTKNQVPTIALPTLQCPSLPNRRSGKAALTSSGHVHPHRISGRSRSGRHKVSMLPAESRREAKEDFRV